MKPSNILHIDSLTEDWRDKDSVILHACFQVLKDFVEQELAQSDWVDWEQDKKHRLAKKEIDALYAWWTTYNDTGLPDKEENQLENDMLKRLIDVRWVMWT